MNSVKSGGSRGSRRSKNSKGSKSSTGSRRMFSELQRGELKIVLAKKFKKKYKDQEGSWIADMVSKFVDANDDLNSNKLKQLEASLKQGRDPCSNSQKDVDELSNRSGISRMSGATDFNKFQDKNVKVKSKQMLELEAKRKKQQELEQARKNKPNVGFEFVKEEDEWAAIARYNKYLFDKRAREKRTNEQRVQKQMYKDLKEQQKIKKTTLSHAQTEDSLYHEQVLKQLRKMKEREDFEKSEYHRKQMEQKAQRDHQLDQRRNRRRQDQKKQKAIDRFIVASINNETVKEKQLDEKRKGKEKEIWRKILAQNEAKKVIEMAKQQRERQENVAMQKAYTKLITQQEMKRQQAFANRETKLKEFSEQNAKLFGEIKEGQDKRLHKKMLRYQKRRNRQLDEREKARVDKIEQNKVELKSFLFMQMDKRQQRDQAAKADIMEQAKIWEVEKKEFDQFEHNKAVARKNAYMTFSKQLKTQIEANKLKEKDNKFIMNAEGNRFNKQLLGDIQNLALEGRSLH